MSAIHYSGPIRFTRGRWTTINHGGDSACGIHATAKTLNPERVTCKRCLVNMRLAGLFE